MSADRISAATMVSLSCEVHCASGFVVAVDAGSRSADPIAAMITIETTAAERQAET